MGWVGWIASHGYATVAGLLLLSSLGLPLPTVVALILAGSAAHNGSLRLVPLVVVAVAAENLGATLLYAGGRLTGWWLLGRLCRVTMDPETCIFRSADFFYRRGARALLFARFLPGLGNMAAPLAGSLNMRPWRYWRYELAGDVIHVGAWLSMGYLLSPFIRAVTDALAVVGHVVFGTALLVGLGYLLTWLVIRVRDRKYRDVQKVLPEELLERMANPDPERPIVIADVRSHGYYDPGMQRIKNSIRVEPNRLLIEMEALRETLAIECDVYLYCSCIRDATSVRVAHTLTQRGHKVRVVEGGLRNWLKSGAPTEPVPDNEMHHLPRFD